MEKKPLPLPGSTRVARPAPATLDLLRTAPEDAPVVLLIRHAAREPIVGVEDGWRAPLTDVGRADAATLGTLLADAGYVDASAFASPAPRCVETAALVTGGLPSPPAEVLTDRRFGGPYVLDQRRAFERMLRLGNAAFLRAWFDGGWGDALQPADTAARELFDAAASLLSPPGPRLRVVVSHDWNIALLRDRLLGVRHERVGLPDFLDGVVVYAQRGRLVLADRSGMRWHEARDGDTP